MSVVGRLRAVVMLALLGACGCASPRFVSLGPEGGTLAMPFNSSWYHDKAIAMLHEKYPDGYVIDREHETEVRAEWRIDFHPKGVEVARTPPKPTIQQMSYTPPPVKAIRALPKEPVPVQ